jgi:nitrite reductase (NADH) small subunit
MTWQKVCLEVALPAGARVIVELAGKQIGFFNVDGRIYALNNRCPHAGAPVCLGEVTGTVEVVDGYRLRSIREREVLRCPWHAWEFDIESGCTLTQPTRRIKRYEVKVTDGWVWLDA